MIVLAAAGLLLLTSNSSAQRGMFRRYELARPESFDGAFQFCRVLFRGAANGDGGDWQVDFPRADSNLMTRLSELTKTPISRLPRRRAESPDHPAGAARAVQVPVHHDDRGRQHLPRRGRGQEPSRVPAEGRFSLGRRLLGRVRLGGVGQPVPQGAADGRVSVSVDLPIEHPIFRQFYHGPAFPADSIDRLCGAARAAGRRSAGSTAVCRMRARSSTTTAGSWCSSPTTPTSAIRSRRKRPIANTSSSSRCDGYAFGINALLYAMSH